MGTETEPLKPFVEMLTRIEAKLDRALDGPESPIVDVAEAMRLVGAKSRYALYRILKKLGVKPCLPGKYRRLDITNALARRALFQK